MRGNFEKQIHPVVAHPLYGINQQGRDCCYESPEKGCDEGVEAKGMDPGQDIGIDEQEQYRKHCEGQHI